jgi:exodeoxyribonuclease-1
MNSARTFFFYDLETSGLDPRLDRIMQFAGQHTDFNLSPIGDPINLLVKLADDTLPSPYATLVTKITPQTTQTDGLTEAEFCRLITTDVFTPGTVAVGYNNIRFDDEFIRHLLWRNFHDPYEWSWKDHRSRWDLLDVVRLTRALRPESINWPFDKDGKATNRLELITKLNHIGHTTVHDALSDVTALIGVTKLIKTKQPKLFNYLFKMRDKKEVQKLVNLENPQPFVYASGRLSSEHNKTSVFYPLAPAPSKNVLVYDLRYNLDDLLIGKKDNSNGVCGRGACYTPISSPTAATAPREDGRARERTPFELSFFPIVKELKYNRCPAVAPLSVLDQQDGWQKLGLDKKTIEQNLQTLLKDPTFAEQIRTNAEEQPEFPPAPDPEAALYDGFLGDADRVRCAAIKNTQPADLVDCHPEFADPRLPELLIHYKARNFPDTLSAPEQQSWEAYRAQRLKRQAPTFIKELEDLTAARQDPFLLEELHLWYQALN